MRISGARIGSVWLKTVVAATLVVAGGNLVAVAPASAGPTKPLCSAARSISSSGSELNTAVANMRMAGNTQQQIDNALAKEFGLQLMTKPQTEVPVSGDVSIQAVSTGNDVTVDKPGIYRNTCSSSWYVIAAYRWTTMSRFRSEWPLICGSPCALSGTDGFGIALSRAVPNLGGSSMTTWGVSSKFPISDTRAWIDTPSSLGYWYEGVDHFSGGCCPDDYSFYNGQMVMTIYDPGCGSLQASSRYAHTWSNTSINGVSFGPMSIGVSWSGASYRWSKGSTNSTAVYFC
jgi:hypothetical protein